MHFSDGAPLGEGILISIFHAVPGRKRQQHRSLRVIHPLPSPAAGGTIVPSISPLLMYGDVWQLR